MKRVVNNLVMMVLFFAFGQKIEAQTWVNELNLKHKDSFAFDWKAVRSTFIDNEKFTLYSRQGPNNKFVVIKTDTTGSILQTYSYEDMNPIDMISIEFNGQKELVISGVGNGSKGQIRRVSPSNGAILSIQNYIELSAIYRAQQCHLTSNQGKLIILANVKGTNSSVCAVDLNTNEILSNVSFSGKFGHGLAVSDLSDNIIVGLSTAGPLSKPITIYAFSITLNGAIIRKDIVDFSSRLPSKSLVISTSANSAIDVMKSIPNSDNVVFGYVDANPNYLSSVGILEFNGLGYSLNFGTQNRINYGLGRRLQDISVNDNGTEICVGMLVYYLNGNPTTAGGIAFQRMKFLNGKFDISAKRSNVNEIYKVCKNMTYLYGSSLVSAYNKKSLYSDASPIRSGNNKIIFGKHGLLSSATNTCIEDVSVSDSGSVAGFFFSIDSSGLYSMSTVTKFGITSLMTAVEPQKIVCSQGELSNKALERNQSFKIYPVPASQSLTVEFSNSQTLKGNLEIYDFTGKFIEKFNCNGLAELKIDVTNYKTGNYILKCHDKIRSQVFSVMR